MRIILILTLLFSIQSFGQNPPGYQSRTVRERINGSFMVDSTQHLPRYCGKPSGVRGGGSVQDGAIAIDTCNNLVYYYSGGVWRTPGIQSIPCGLICSDCGLVTWTGTGLNFYVTAATYNLDGATYSFAGDSISLAAADATFDRFDAIVLTSTGLAKVTGSASATPQLPQFNPCDTILLSNIFVAANTPTPTLVTDEVVYDEDAEWTHTQSGVASVNFASTAEAIHGTKSVRVATWGNGANLIFTEGGSVPVNSFSTFSFWIRLFVAFTSNQNLSVQFFDGTSAVSNQVPITFNKSTINTWQGITLSPSQFTFTSSTFTAIRFILGGNGVSTFYLDWVRFQNGVSQPTIPGQITSAYNRITDGTNTATASGADIFKIRGSNTILATVTNNDATHGDNVILKADTSATGLATQHDLTLLGGGSGTINSGTTGKPAYYVGATTLDDFAPIDYATSGNLQTITHQNTTDVGTLYQGIAVQTGNFITAKNSGAATVFELTKDGHLFLAEGGIINWDNGDATLTQTGNSLALAGADLTVAGTISVTGSTGGFIINDRTVAEVFTNYAAAGGYRIYNNASASNEFSIQRNQSTGLMTAGVHPTPTSFWHLKAGTSTATQAPLKFTAGTNLATTEAGAIEYDGTHLYYTASNAGTRYQLDRQSSLTKSKGMTLESPGSAEDFGMWKTQVDITVSSINAVVKGSSPSVTINIAFGSDITSLTNVFTAGTAITNTTTGQTVNSGFNDATIPAGSWIRLISTASSGTITQIEVTINYTED